MTGLTHREGSHIIDDSELIGMDLDGESIGSRDEETGEKFISIKTTIIAIIGLVYLILAAQILFQAFMFSVDRWIVQDPQFQDEKTKEKIVVYTIASFVMLIVFFFVTRYLINEPIHLFY